MAPPPLSWIALSTSSIILILHARATCKTVQYSSRFDMKAVVSSTVLYIMCFVQTILLIFYDYAWPGCSSCRTLLVGQSSMFALIHYEMLFFLWVKAKETKENIDQFPEIVIEKILPISILAIFFGAIIAFLVIGAESPRCITSPDRSDWKCLSNANATGESARFSVIAYLGASVYVVFSFFFLYLFAHGFWKVGHDVSVSETYWRTLEINFFGSLMIVFMGTFTFIAYPFSSRDFGFLPALDLTILVIVSFFMVRANRKMVVGCCEKTPCRRCITGSAGLDRMTSEPTFTPSPKYGKESIDEDLDGNVHIRRVV